MEKKIKSIESEELITKKTFPSLHYINLDGIGASSKKNQKRDLASKKKNRKKYGKTRGSHMYETSYKRKTIVLYLATNFYGLKFNSYSSLI